MIPHIEKQTTAEIKAFQELKLQEVLQYVSANSVYYQNLFQEHNIDISKKEISDIFDISDVTISKTYRKIFPYHNILMSNKVTNLILDAKNKIIKSSNNITKNNLIISNLSEKDSDIDTESLEEDTDSEKIIKNNKVKKTISLSL